MRVFDEMGNLLDAWDETKGRLVKDRLFLRSHAATEAVEEQGHWETVEEYPNGGQDVAWVVDIPGVEAKEAWDEYEDILRFLPFTANELAVRRIEELKKKLLDTDYHILKIVEGSATLSEMAEVIANRTQWRKEIGELEKETRS